MEDLLVLATAALSGTVLWLVVISVPEGVMGWDDWILLIVSVAVAVYLAIALWKPERF